MARKNIPVDAAMTDRRVSGRRIVLAVVTLLVSLPLEAAGWKVSIREFNVPTAGSRPHDPEVAPDGSLWYTGQLANKMGRLDPKTGTIREFSLPRPESGPHGLAADRYGNMWFTANSAGYIGKLDPRTGRVTEYAMPDPRARDPHSLAFVADGRIFFTVQGGKTRSEDGQSLPRGSFHSASASLRDRRRVRRRRVLLRVRKQPDRTHRSGYAPDPRICAAGGSAAAADRDEPGRLPLLQ